MIEQYPQVLLNVKVPNGLKKTIAEEESVAKLIRKETENFGEDGRILVRPSGTEALVRVMVEGKNEAEVSRVAKCIADKIAGQPGEKEKKR